MNWLKKYSKILLFIVVALSICSNFCFSEVISGSVRKEIDISKKKKVELPEVKQRYSTGSILAYNKGIEYFNLQEYDKSIESYLLAIKQEPKFADAYFNLGIIYDHFDNTSNALLAFNRAYVINKKDYEALYHVVHCYIKMGDNVAAKYYFNKIPKESEFYTKGKELFK